VINVKMWFAIAQTKESVTNLELAFVNQNLWAKIAKAK